MRKNENNFCVWGKNSQIIDLGLCIIVFEIWNFNIVTKKRGKDCITVHNCKTHLKISFLLFIISFSDLCFSLPDVNVTQSCEHRVVEDFFPLNFFFSNSPPPPAITRRIVLAQSHHIVIICVNFCHSVRWNLLLICIESL